MSATQATNLVYARIARDAGIQQAIDHAQDVCFDWPYRAYAFLVEFAQNNERFISEDVSDASKSVRGFPQPTTDRAWGSAYIRAAKEGVIVQDGAGRSRRRHASICPKWRSLIYAGEGA